jgi:hypothetical protein
LLVQRELKEQAKKRAEERDKLLEDLHKLAEESEKLLEDLRKLAMASEIGMYKLDEELEWNTLYVEALLNFTKILQADVRGVRLADKEHID